MADTIQMPKLGFDMAEGTLVRWLKGIGDVISKGDVIAEIETDKATIEIETVATGTVLQHLVHEGDIVPVGADIAWVGEAGEAAPAGGDAAPVAAVTEEAAPTITEPATAPYAPPAVMPASQNGGRIKASPLAKRMAQEKGIDLAQVAGSGPGGRIVKRDVEGFVPAAAPATQPAVPTQPTAAAPPAAIPAATYGSLPDGPDVEIIETSNLRGRIASRMINAKQQVPHFYVTSDIDIDEMLALRKRINAGLDEGAARVSVNDMIVKAAALTLRKFPNLNSHFYGDQIVRHKRINIGMAVALDEGLLNVIAKDADKTALGTMAAQNKDMIMRARGGKVRPDDIEGGTFTVSNLGPFDVDQFVAIINPPEAAILAIGTGKKAPVVQEDGTVGVSTRLKITISADHRVTDGAEAAAFMFEMKKLIENPMSLLI